MIVGAGFAGLYMLHSLREAGLSAVVYDAAPEVGGTWYWNRYPGCRCDIESMQYSFQFDDDLQQDWTWSERYASQPELLAYIKHVAERFDLRRDISLETRVAAAEFDQSNDYWTVATQGAGAAADGATTMVTARAPDPWCWLSVNHRDAHVRR